MAWLGSRRVADDQLEALRHLYNEGRTNVDAQLATGTDLDTKASQVFRFNSLVVGILVSAISIFLRFENVPLEMGDWVLYAMGAGVVLLSVSALLAIMAYMVTEFATGLRAEDIEGAHQEGFGEEDLLGEMVEAYARAVETNRANIDTTARRLRYSLWTLFGGLVVLGASAIGLIYYAGAV